jgi:hypothetical protein
MKYLRKSTICAALALGFASATTYAQGKVKQAGQDAVTQTDRATKKAVNKTESATTKAAKKAAQETKKAGKTAATDVKKGINKLK